MKPVALITLEYPPDTGGVARYVSALVRESKGALMVRRVTPPRVPFGWLAWVPLCLRLRHTARALLVSHVLPVGTATWMARWVGGIPYHLVLHGLDIRLASRSAWKCWLTRRIIRNAQTVFVNSLFTKGLLRTLCPEIDAVLVTPGVEVVDLPSKGDARRALGIQADERLVLSVGRLVRRKGHDVLLDAYTRLETPARLVIIGQGPEERVLRERARLMGERVQIITQASDEERWKWYAAADVFAQPLRNEPNDPEGFGILFLEAGLAGLPVIAGRNGGASEAVIDGQTGYIVEPGRTEEVTRLLEELLTNRALAERLGEAGRIHALRDCSWRERWLTLAAYL